MIGSQDIRETGSAAIDHKRSECLTGHPHTPVGASQQTLDIPFHINGDMSRRMYEVLAERVPRVEPYSIDVI